jgi:hypothetical protein
MRYITQEHTKLISTLKNCKPQKLNISKHPLTTPWGIFFCSYHI